MLCLAAHLLFLCPLSMICFLPFLLRSISPWKPFLKFPVGNSFSFIWVTTALYWISRGHFSLTTVWNAGTWGGEGEFKGHHWESMAELVSRTLGEKGSREKLSDNRSVEGGKKRKMKLTRRGNEPQENRRAMSPGRPHPKYWFWKSGRAFTMASDKGRNTKKNKILYFL